MWSHPRALTAFLLVLSASASATGQPAASHHPARGDRTARNHEQRSSQRHSGSAKPGLIRLEQLLLRASARPSLVARVNSRFASRSLSLTRRPSTGPEQNKLVPTALERPHSVEAEITILFKDRRAPEQIRNYALSRTVLYIPGDPDQVIPVKQIDLPATERLNRQRGRLFELPVSP